MRVFLETERSLLRRFTATEGSRALIRKGFTELGAWRVVHRYADP
jgi:hypothetical protein